METRLSKTSFRWSRLGRLRSCDLSIISRMLYQTELRVDVSLAYASSLCRVSFSMFSALTFGPGAERR